MRDWEEKRERISHSWHTRSDSMNVRVLRLRYKSEGEEKGLWHQCRTLERRTDGRKRRDILVSIILARGREAETRPSLCAMLHTSVVLYCTVHTQGPLWANDSHYVRHMRDLLYFSVRVERDIRGMKKWAAQEKVYEMCAGLYFFGKRCVVILSGQW